MAKAKTKTMMGIDEAKGIIENPGLYSSADVLSAVRCVRDNASSHPELSDKLAAFYELYHEYRKSYESGGYNDHDIVMQIFGGHEEYHKEYLDRAIDIADKLKKAEKKKIDITEFSFAELDTIQSMVRALGINGAEPTAFEAATRKLNTVMDYKLQHLSNKTALAPEEAEAIEHFVDNVKEEDTKKKLANLLAKKVVSSYDEENGLLNEVDMLLQNDEKANDVLDSINLYDDEGNVTKDFADIANVLENVSIVDDNGQELDEENRRKHLQILFDAAKVDVHKDAIGDKEHPANQSLVERVQEAFYLKMGQAAVASTIERPNEKDLENEDKFNQYLEERDKAAIAVIDRLVNRKTPIKFNSEQAEMAVIDTQLNAEKFVARLGRKLGDKKTKLAARVQNISVGAKNLWGQRHEIKKVVVKSVKDNKWQHITNLAAGLGVVVLTGASMPAGVAIGAIAAYSLYTAAGAQLWPLSAGRKKLQAEAKENGKKLSWKEAMEQAWENKKDDPAYKTRRRWGYIGALAGGALGGLGLGLGILGGGNVARLIASSARAITGTAAQGSLLAEAKKENTLHPSAENKDKLKAARAFFWLTAASSTLTAFLTSKAAGANTAEAANGTNTSDGGLISKLRDIFKGKDSVGADSTAFLTSKAAGANTAEAANGTNTSDGGLISKLRDIFKGKDSVGADSTAVADTTSGADSIPEVAPEDLGFGGPKIPVDVNSFSPDELQMRDYSASILGHGNKKSGMAVLENYYDAFRVGKIESLPDGVTPAQYTDVMIRLHGYPVHSEAVKLMHREFDCNTFHPTDEQKQMIANAIKDVCYEHGTMKVAVKNDCGQLVAIDVDTFGQYVGKGDKMVDVNGQSLRLRRLTRVTGIDANVDCGGDVTLFNKVRRGSLPCDDVVENNPSAPQKDASSVEITPKVDLPDLSGASMAENTEGYQTSGKYYPPIDRHTDYDAAVQHITADSFAKNTVMQNIKSNYAAASQAEGFSLKKFIKACGGELLDDKENGDITFTINHGTVIDTKQGLMDAAQGAHIEVSMKHEDFMHFAETGELPSSTKEVPLTDENHKAILNDDNFAYDQTKGDRAYFDTSVAGAEHFSCYAPVDFDTSAEVGQLSANNDIVLPTAQGNVVVHIDAKTGDITAMLGNKPVRFSSETQQEAEEALKGALKARYNVASLSLAAPEGTLAKKCEVAMQTGRAVAMEYNPNHSGNAIGRVNFNDYNGR